MYRTRAIITRCLYNFYPLFEVQKRFFQGAFFLKFWPYVWYSRAVSNQQRVIVARIRYMLGLVYFGHCFQQTLKVQGLA